MIGNVATLNDTGNTEINLILSLINIEEDVLLRNPENFFKRDLSTVYKNPPKHFNLTIIFGANNAAATDKQQAYLQALQHIQIIIGFFQSQNVFDRNNSPDLPEGIDKLVFELVNLNLEQLHHLWGMLGGKYIPSVVYKMRLVTIDDAQEEREAPLITQIKINDHLKFQQ